MILFLVSFFLTIATSYLLTSILDNRKSILGLIYIFLLSFSQIVLILETLSLFNAINVPNILLSNFILFSGSFLAWRKFAETFWSLDCKNGINRFINSLKKDKHLIWLSVGFLVFFITAIFLSAIMPVSNADGQGYHVVRSFFWAAQGNLNHFETADIRNLCFPINSEILYTWLVVFFKKDVLIGFVAFSGYLLTVISTYSILTLLKMSTRRKLWIILILSSFPSVLVQASGTETDIIIAGLIASSIFLYYKSIQENKNIALYMSSLAWALAIGTKTTAFIFLPFCLMLFLLIAIRHKKNNLFKKFLGFTFVNFIIFASYNFVLNYIQFQNFTTSSSLYVANTNLWGLKGMMANFIKYWFMFFDLPGFTIAKNITPIASSLRENVLSLFNLASIPDGRYSMPYYVNSKILEPLMGIGILGLIVFIPNLLISLISPIFKSKSHKRKTIALFALGFIINLLTMSYLLAYMTFSIRFLMSIIVLSAPILYYSYTRKNNFLKNLIVIIALFNFIFISTHLWARPMVKIIKCLQLKPSIENIRERAICKDFNRHPEYTNSACVLRDKIKSDFPPKIKILSFMSAGDFIYPIKLMEKDGYKVTFARIENALDIDFSKFDVVITVDNGQTATFIANPEAKNDENTIIFKDEIISKSQKPIICHYSYIPKVKGKIEPKRLAYYQVQCKFSDDFISGKHLEFHSSTGLINPDMNDFRYYKLYKVKK